MYDQSHEITLCASTHITRSTRYHPLLHEPTAILTVQPGVGVTPHNANAECQQAGLRTPRSRHVRFAAMTTHPLPELPREELQNECINSWQVRNAQVRGESGYGSVLGDNDEYPASFNDASGTCRNTFGSPQPNTMNPTAKTIGNGACRDSVVPTPPLSPHDNASPPAYDILCNHHPGSRVDEIASHEQNPQNNLFWLSNKTSSHDAEVLFPQPSPNPPVNGITSHSRSLRNDPAYQSYDDPLYDASTDSDSDYQRIPLVRFAPTHTFLRTPSPPIPPPHQVTARPMPPSIPNPLISRSSYTSLSSSSPTIYLPYGPRTPPWGSQETLARERRNRIDTRGRDSLLQERFEVDRQRREWRWRRVEEDTRMGRRRSEGERVRALVRKLYPDEEDEDRRERGCILCVMM